MKLSTVAKSLAVGAISVGLLTGCPQQNKSLDLTILHINDHHSHLDEDSITLDIGGNEIEMASGGFPRVSAAFKELEANASNPVLKLHAGDAITGTLYYTLFKGEADAAMMNEVCFDAFALGNHEFDDSDEGLKKFLDFLNPVANKCPTTPVLAANIKPQVGTPLAPNKVNDYIKPYVVKTINGEKVGIIGIDIVGKTVNSSSPLATTKFYDEVTTAQEMIDKLELLGVNKIILMTHYQYLNDLDMASKLDGVDVIVGGDSHTLLGDFSHVGLNSGGDYPTKVKDKKGNPVCVVQAWQYAQVVGELNVSFNKKGKVTKCEGTPHLLVENPTEKNGVAMTDAEISTAITQIKNTDNLTYISDDAQTASTLASYSDQVDVLKQIKIGESVDNLCLERKPGQGYSSICSAEETKPHGGDIQMVVANAFREMSLTSDISIQNAGGVRIDVPVGDLTIDTAYTLLPFSNTLVELKMTGAQIKQVLEEATDYALVPGGSTGAYPYAAGLRWDMDFTQAFGSRLSNLEFKGRDDTDWVPFDLNRTYTVVTNDYTAGGRDGYLTFADVTGDDYVDTFLDYAQSFVDYVTEIEANGQHLEKLPYSEYSTQNFTDEAGNFYPAK